jgi:hypothetical protein
MLYNLAYDLKRMLDDNTETKTVYDMVAKRIRRDFTDTTWKKIEWKDNGRKYVEKEVSAEFVDVDEVTRLKKYETAIENSLDLDEVLM